MKASMRALPPGRPEYEVTLVCTKQESDTIRAALSLSAPMPSAVSAVFKERCEQLWAALWAMEQE